MPYPATFIDASRLPKALRDELGISPARRVRIEEVTPEEEEAERYRAAGLTENGLTPEQEDKILAAAEEAKKADPISAEEFLQELKEIADAD